MHKAIIILVVALLFVFTCGERGVAQEAEPISISFWFAPDGGGAAKCARDCWKFIYQPCVNRNPDDPEVCLYLFLNCFDSCINANAGSLVNWRWHPLWDYLRRADQVCPACPDCKI